MAKNFRRMLAIAMVLSMCISAMPMQALAETTTEDIVNDNGDTIGTMTIEVTPSESGSGSTTNTSWSTQESSSEGSKEAVTSASGESHETVESTDDKTTVSGNSSSQEEAVITDTQKQENQPLYKDPEEPKLTPEGDPVPKWEEPPEEPVITEEGEWEKVQDSEYKKDESTVENEDSVNEEVQVKVDTEKGTSILIDVPTADSSKPYEETFNKGSETVGGINVVENAFPNLSKEDQAAIQKLIEAAADPEMEQATIEYTVNGTKITVTASVDKDGKIIRDELGNVFQYTVTKETEHAVNLDNIHDGNGNTPVGTVETTGTGTTKYVEPEGDYEVGTKSSTNEKGEPVTEVTEAIYAEDGKTIIGYRITTTTEKTSVYTGEAMGPAQQPTPKEDKFELPAKPVVPNPKDDAKLSSTAVVTEIKNGEEVVGYTTVDNGITTTTQVTEAKDENGKTIGWTTTTVVTDASGKEISYKSDTIYGTEYSYTKSETWDPETEKKYDINVTEIRGITRTDDVTITTNGVHTNVKDVTNDVYTLVNTGTGTYFVYEGKVYAVTGTSNLTASDLTGGINLSQYGTAQGDDNDDLRLKDEAENSGYYPNNYVNSNFAYNNGWNYDGFGMVSDFEVQGNTEHRVRLFKINNNGTIRYAYCVELGAQISPDYYYGSKEYGKDETGAVQENENVVPWTDAKGTVAQLRSVALNGYWGTDDGLGSLQAVKDLMLRNGFTTEEANSLTPGMALAATQVAIWYFGSKDSSEFGTVGSTDAASGKFGLEYFHTDADDAVNQTTELAEKEDVVNKLRNLLVRLANDESGAGKAEVLTAENTFTQAGFVIHDKVVVETEEAQASHVNYDDNEDNDVYNTDVQFKLDVSTSSFNGDLIVKVKVGDKVVGAGRLAGNAKDSDTFWNGIEDVLFDKIYPDPETGIYTIPGLQLAENVMIDLKLEGTQHLDDGVYVFKHDTLQDFISLSKLENNVNFTMQMEFNVTDPGTADVSKSQSSWKETKDVAYRKTDKGTQKNNGTETTVKTGERKEIYGTITITETETQKTGEEHFWRNLFFHPETPTENPRMRRGGEPAPQPQIFRLNNNNLVEIPEEPVPLATPAITGDNSGLWVAVILIALCGIVAVNVFDKKRQHESF